MDAPKIISRRALLRGVGVAGAAAVAAPAGLLVSTSDAGAAPAAAQTSAGAAAGRQVYQHLTASEAELLEAMVDRLIPADALGPGAKDAGVLTYIDRALGSALASSRAAYTAGLAALDRYASASRGQGFLALNARDRDSVLMDVESGTVTPGIFTGNSTQFFSMVLGHTRQGMFGDPFYGGNKDFIGWDLLRYPGVRTTVTAADQKSLEADQLKPNHRSAYDNEMFVKATARNDAHDQDHNGDGHGH
ncbi:MAG: gluconate 2-dehydrogenase subunit 3 family protein [Acidobacteriaceae bacterium]|jgi:gluconate 2-dehydrogenase gamma chain|nr:gluconate 2-dehydrogenase subunit 3 family protein [Acidobacteriaceae bacterium]